MKQQLLEFFTRGAADTPLGSSVGAEVETHFVTRDDGRPASPDQSQYTFGRLIARGWRVKRQIGGVLCEIQSPAGDRLLFELGRHNLELATAPRPAPEVLPALRRDLGQLYEAAWEAGLEPRFQPILEGDEDLLALVEERDKIWLRLDGREALAPLARIASVHFTFAVGPGRALECLRILSARRQALLRDYPQDRIWRRFLERSRAPYLPSRYGGPRSFGSLEDYCRELSRHHVVQDARLVPMAEAGDFDIPMFLRSVWWYFRLKRYDEHLCVEVRPLARRDDETLGRQLGSLLHLLSTRTPSSVPPARISS